LLGELERDPFVAQQLGGREGGGAAARGRRDRRDLLQAEETPDE